MHLHPDPRFFESFVELILSEPDKHWISTKANQNLLRPKVVESNNFYRLPSGLRFFQVTAQKISSGQANITQHKKHVTPIEVDGT